MGTWQRLAGLSDEALGCVDMAHVNLACAEGLPGAEEIDFAQCLKTVDEWAGLVSLGVRRMRQDFEVRPREYQNSRAYCRALTMITVLQRNLGIEYNPDLQDDDAVFGPEDVFLHGIIRTKKGTCANMPVLYVAVGRKAGFPLWLVRARNHLFARWDGDGDRFNIEGTNKGLNCFPDDDYRQGRYAVTREDERQGKLLKSMSPREEFGDFLAQRGYVRLDGGSHRHAAKSFAWASKMAPDNKFHAQCLVSVLDRWKNKLQPKLETCWPRVTVKYPEQQFPHMPLRFERMIVSTEVSEDLFEHAWNANHEVFIDYPAKQLWRI